MDEADAYQLLAYAMRYGCTALNLAYPMPEGTNGHQKPPTFDLVAAGQGITVTITIKVKLVPLWTKGAVSTAGQDQHLIETEAG